MGFIAETNHGVIWHIVTVVLLVFIAFQVYTINTTLQGMQNPAAPVVEEPALVPEPEPQPEPVPIDMAALPDDDAVKGDPDAPVTIIEFSDYQCPYCGRYATQTLPKLIENYVDTGKVKMVFRDYPLEFHEQAEGAAIAAECAGDQGNYWAYHDILFANSADLSEENYKKWADDLGLDTEQFASCLADLAVKDEVQKDFKDGAAIGVTGTPSFVINGRTIVGAQPYEQFATIIDEALK